MDTAQWPQEIVVKPIEGNNTIAKQSSSTSLERKAVTTPRPHRKDQALNCPRCNSTNTKFCYYNNYSLTQPRYFCKTCKRYWTEGGSLRNIPVGGGSNKKHKNVMIRSDPISSSSNLKKFPDPPSTNTFSHQYDIQNPNSKICTPQQQQQGQDRNLSFTSQLVQVHQGLVSNDHQTSNKTQLLGLELLTGFSNATTGLNLNSNFMAMDGPTISSVYNNATSAAGFNINNNTSSTTNNQLMHGHGDDDLKPAATLSFSLDGFGGGIGFSNLQESGNSGGRLLFPFDNLLHQQQVSSDQQNKDHNNNNNNNNGDPNSSVYWSGMLGDGSW